MVRQTLHPNRAAVVKSPWILLWIFATLSLTELYSFFNDPKYWVEVKMFPFDETAISFQAWVDYVATRVMVISFLLLLSKLLPYYRRELVVFFWLAVGYLVDFFVIYNNHILRIGAIKISYTLLMLIIMIFVVGDSFYRAWK
jgi:hypothetical protein